MLPCRCGTGRGTARGEAIGMGRGELVGIARGEGRGSTRGEDAGGSWSDGRRRCDWWDGVGLDGEAILC